MEKLASVVVLVFYIQSLKGNIVYFSSVNNSNECQNYSHCYSLEEYQDNFSSNTEYKFLSGVHELYTTIEIMNKSNLHFNGIQPARIVCNNKSAAKFLNNTNVIIEKLSFEGCGSDNTSSLVFFGGTNLILMDITISGALNAGICITNVKENTIISNLTIINTITTHNITEGNQINYANCIHDYHDYHYNLTLSDSTIANNNQFKLSSNSHPKKQISGLTISVKRCYATIRIENTNFMNNTGIHYGGNLALVLTNITNISKLQVYVKDCRIENGLAIGGAGIFITTAIFFERNLTMPLPQNPSDPLPQNSSDRSIIIIENVIICENHAEILAAGLYITQKHSPQDRVGNHSIIIRNCTFYGNYLEKPKHGGVALHSNNYILDGYLPQVNPQYTIIVKDCLFICNYILNQTTTSGNSVIFINSNEYFGIEDVQITNNNVSAISAISSNLLFKGNTILSYNKGSSGGGLLFCQNSIMYLTQNTNIAIYNNSVEHAGGGICIEAECLQTKPRCFFQLDYLVKLNTSLIHTINIHIYNNTAIYGGDNLFGGDVDLCYMLDSPQNNAPPLKGYSVYNLTFNIPAAISSVTSSPRQILFCNCESEDNRWKFREEHELVSAYPGDEFQICAVLVGQENGTVPGVVRTSIQTDNITISHGSVQNISRYCSTLNYTIHVSIDTPLPHNVTLEIDAQHTGDKSGPERSSEFKMRHLKVHLKHCPIGFNLSYDHKIHKLSNSSCKNCYIPNPNFQCEIDNGNVYIKRQTSQSDANWIAYEYDDSNDSMPISIKYGETCPFDYCNNENIKLYMNKTKYKDDLLCNGNRRGLLCGSCKEGYSALLGTTNCGKCTNYYLILLIVFALAGLLLVVALTLLNLTISEGTLSGLIFYGNIVQSNVSFLVPRQYDKIYPTPILKVFIAWINLDFGIKSCFYDGMTAYAEAWLQLVFPLYIWLIAIIIIILSNKFQIVAKVASRNAVKVLATLILLSYTRFLYAVINNLTYTKVCTLKENNTIVPNQVWLIDANEPYFGTKLIILFVVAILLILLSLPFTIVLLFIKPLQRVSHKRGFTWVQKIKPFLDAFTGPYTDIGRFWPGLLLVVRVILSIALGTNHFNGHQTISGMVALSVIFLLVVAQQIRPGLYTVRGLDALECFFLFNLTLLFLGNGYFSDDNNKQKAVFDILVGSAFLVFILILMHHIWLKLRRYKISMDAVQWLKKKTEYIRAPTIMTTQRLDNYPPHFKFIEEREPLLADHED